MPLSDEMFARKLRRGGFSQPSGTFPLGIHSSGKFFVRADGNPHLLNGITPWMLLNQLTNAQIDQYLMDRAARGFNAILIEAPGFKFTSQSPTTNNVDGVAPFTSMAGNYDWVLNTSFWARLVYIVSRCKDLGIFVLINLAYLGFDGLDEGCETQVSGTADGTLQTYGAAVATLLAAYNNIGWCMGGDQDPDDTLRDKQWQIITGIRTVRVTDIVTAHGAPGSPSFPIWGSKTGYNAHTAYPGDVADVYSETLTEYDRGTRPVVMIEAIYVQERSSPINDLGLRRQTMQAYLSGAAMQFFGGGPEWGFGAPNMPFTYSGTWQSNLGATPYVQQGYIKQLMDSVAWWKLVPKQSDNSLVNGSKSSGVNRICPAMADDNTFALIWVPSSQTVPVVMSGFAPSNVRVRRFNIPTNTYTSLGTFANSGSQNIATGDEGVLVLDAA